MTHGKKKRLLFLSHRVPFPVFNGQSTRTYNVLRLLHRDFDVYAICFDNVDPSRPTLAMSERRAALEPWLRHLDVIPLPQDHSRARFVRDHIISVLSGTAYTLAIYDSRDFRSALSALLQREQFDLVHLESVDLIGYASLVAPLPVVCTHHNVESELLLRRGDSEDNPVVRAYLRHQGGLVRKLERDSLPAVALNITVSESDRVALEAIAPLARFVSIPNGVDTDLFDPSLFSARRRDCAFVGGTNWYPNKEALLWYSNEIAPLLNRNGASPETRWIGFCTDSERAQFQGRNGLVMVGFANDVREELARARCFVVPLRVGGGTRLKVLEAWAMGAPVVSTTVGCEGLNAQHEKNILIADSPREFATAVRRVLSDDDLSLRLGAAGRATALQQYSWNALARDLSAAYLSVAR